MEQQTNSTSNVSLRSIQWALGISAALLSLLLLYLFGVARNDTRADSGIASILTSEDVVENGSFVDGSGRYNDTGSSLKMVIPDDWSEVTSTDFDEKLRLLTIHNQAYRVGTLDDSTSGVVDGLSFQTSIHTGSAVAYWPEEELPSEDVTIAGVNGVQFDFIGENGIAYRRAAIEDNDVTYVFTLYTPIGSDPADYAGDFDELIGLVEV